MTVVDLIEASSTELSRSAEAMTTFDSHVTDFFTDLEDHKNDAERVREAIARFKV